MVSGSSTMGYHHGCLEWFWYLSKTQIPDPENLDGYWIYPIICPKKGQTLP